jgi:hypothetical protein
LAAHEVDRQDALCTVEGLVETQAATPAAEASKTGQAHGAAAEKSETQMNNVNIGTLAGQITFEDKVSTTMEAVLAKVNRLDESFGGMNNSVKTLASGFILGEVAMKAFDKVLDISIGLVEDFTTEGAGIADVEENFLRLAEGADRAGESMLGTLREGTHNTIDDFTLMKTVNDQFAAGIQLTDEQMRTLADGGFALAQAKGIDVADAFDTVNTAMLTGQVRSVQLLTGKIDLAKAEEEYAKQLGTTSERLTTQEKQEASRIAILNAVSDATKRLGEQTDGVDEIIAQVGTAWDNFYNNLIKNVAASPKVVDAFLSIRDSIFETFGGSDAFMETFMSGIEGVADVVTEWSPVIIGWFGKVRDGAVALWDRAVDAWEKYGPLLTGAFEVIQDVIVGVYDAVIGTWDALPDWMKRVAERSAIAAAGMYLVSSGVEAASSSILDITASFATITSGMQSLPALLTSIGGGFATLSTQASIMWAVMDFSSLAQAGASFKLLAGSIASTIGPLGIATAYATALFLAYELGQTEAVSDWFMELGLELQGFTQAEQDAMIATDKAMQATQASAQASKEKTDVLALLEAVQAQVEEGTEALTASVTEQSEALTDTTERTKEYELAWSALNALGTTWQDTLKGVNGDLRASVMEYAKLGASVEELYQAFPKLTKAQAEAAVEAVKAAREIQAVNQETLDIINEAHGNNINDWIEGEERKLAATLESLKLQGKLTEEMLNAQMEKFDATIDAEISKRNEANELSRDHYEMLVDEAQNAYDLLMKDATAHTEREIRESARLLEQRKRDLYQWTHIANGLMDEQTSVVVSETAAQGAAVSQLGQTWRDTVGEAIHETISAVQTMRQETEALNERIRTGAGGVKNDVTRANLDAFAKQYNIPTAAALDMAQRGFSFSEMIQAFQSGQMKSWVPSGPRIPGFREGGFGDFKDGTLAMLHGPEVIVPLDKMGSLGSVTNHFYVNGTAEESARKISQILIRDFKTGRQLNFK